MVSCFNTTGIFLVSHWLNRISLNSNNWNDFNGIFQKDTWNNSAVCCRDPGVYPFYNFKDTVILDRDLQMNVNVSNASRIPVLSSSISTHKSDILYGSFRIVAKMPPIPGSSFGFFFFYSILQEIDIEILMHEPDVVRTAVQPIIRDVFNVATNETQRASRVCCKNEYNEYRFDWFSDNVDFYFNGNYSHSFNKNVPTRAGKIVINHHSNGNQRWSKGPPLENSTVSIKSMDFYFNSTSDKEVCSFNRQKDKENKNVSAWKKYFIPIVVSIVIGCIGIVSGIVYFFVVVYRAKSPVIPVAIPEVHEIASRRT